VSGNGARHFLTGTPFIHRRAALRVTFRGASRAGRGSEYQRSRQGHIVSTTHPNKPMHPTADTPDVINPQLAGRRVIGDVRRLHILEVVKMRLSIWAASLLVLLTFADSEAFACSCRPVTPQQAFEKSSAIFVGEFTGFSFRGKRQPARLKFRIEKQWKGNLPVNVVLPYSDIPGMCGDLHLARGQKHLIYVGLLKGEPHIWVDCGRSRPVKDAAEDLEYLSTQQSRFTASPAPPPNNGMHPTRDTHHFM
jgi:hypothetical protein